MTKLLELERESLELEKKTLELKEEQNELIKTYSEPLYNFSDNEVYLLAQLLCGQEGKSGDGEYDFESQIESGQVNWTEVNKVLEVVMNRTLTPGIYSDNVTDVVLQPGAFSVFPKNLNTTPSPKVIEAVNYWCNCFNSSDYIRSTPENHFWFSAGSRGSNVTRDHL
jgi:hypothetical protein